MFIKLLRKIHDYRKSNLIKSCKRKKLSLSKQPSEGDDLSQGEEALADNECSDDSDSEGWHILEEESEGELEKALEENASRNKLTAYNVKTILHVSLIIKYM